GIFMLEDVAGDCARHAAHVVEGKVVGDKAAPAVGTEFDLGHGIRRSLFAARCSQIQVPRSTWDDHPKGCREQLTTNSERLSHKFLQLLLIQMLYHFADIL